MTLVGTLQDGTRTVRATLPITTCDNCGNDIEFLQIRTVTLGVTPEKTYTLCSYDCMTELGWKLRDRQPKLSKSRTEQSQL